MVFKVFKQLPVGNRIGFRTAVSYLQPVSHIHTASPRLLRHFDFRPQALQKELQLNASAKEKPWEKPKAWSWARFHGGMICSQHPNIQISSFRGVDSIKGEPYRLFLPDLPSVAGGSLR